MSSIPRKLAMVTGASSGIGFEIARQFAARGYDVALTGSSRRIHDAAQVLEAAGVTAFPFRADAGTHEGVESFWSYMASLGRPVDCAALNVGIAIGGAFKDNDLEEELRVIAVNITGTVHLAKRVVQQMVRNQSGRILIVSSVSATTPTPFETVYGPSKAFGFSFAESLREELRETGVSVTALLPGATDTDFHVNAGLANTPIGNLKKHPSALVAMQGVEGLLQGVDHVIGGDEEVAAIVMRNRSLPEVTKAAMHAKLTRMT